MKVAPMRLASCIAALVLWAGSCLAAAGAETDDKPAADTDHSPADPGAPVLACRPAALRAVLIQGCTAELVVSVGNGGREALEWTAVSCPDWATIDPREGRIEPGQTQAISVSVDTRELPSGAFGGRIVLGISHAAKPVEIDLRVEVVQPRHGRWLRRKGRAPEPGSAPGPVRLASPADPGAPVLVCRPAALKAVLIRGCSVALVVRIRNGGKVPIEWGADSCPDWAALDTRAGRLEPGATQTVTVLVDTRGLPPGVLAGSIVLGTSEARGAPVEIELSVEVVQPRYAWLLTREGPPPAPGEALSLARVSLPEGVVASKLGPRRGLWLLTYGVGVTGNITEMSTVWTAQLPAYEERRHLEGRPWELEYRIAHSGMAISDGDYLEDVSYSGVELSLAVRKSRDNPLHRYATGTYASAGASLWLISRFSYWYGGSGPEVEFELDGDVALRLGLHATAGVRVKALRLESQLRIGPFLSGLYPSGYPKLVPKTPVTLCLSLGFGWEW